MLSGSTGVDIQSVGADGVQKMTALAEMLERRGEGEARVKALWLEEYESEWEEGPPAQGEYIPSRLLRGL